MVVCADISSECHGPSVTKTGFFAKSQFHDDFLRQNVDTNNNNNNNSNDNNNNNLLASSDVAEANRYCIKEFYRNSVVLVTGATGFLGKVLLEKLLRTCDNVQCIYVLLRPKRGMNSEQRYKELIQNVIFDRIRAKNPDVLKKLIFIAGDISKPNIGLNSTDLQVLKDRVNIVFHSAAQVRFDQSIREAAVLNTLGSKRLWDLCVEMKSLKSIIHVSTAYTNPTQKVVGEKVYPPKMEMSQETFMECTSVLPEDLVHEIATRLQGEHPNSYTLTKSMAEQMAADYHHKLPITIVRPSIVCGSYAEPYPGWVDNINGITGIIMEIGRGTISSIMCDRTLTLDVIPVDIVCNMIVTAAWLNYYKPTNSIRVYNCTSGQLNELKWQTCLLKVLKYSRLYPSKYVMMYPNCDYRQNRFVHRIYELLLHFLPALLYDCYLRTQGVKPIMMRIAKRYKSAAETGEFFARHEWQFEVNNVNELLDEVNLTVDHDEFRCDIKAVDWDEYFKNYVFGIRKFILKDDLSSIERSKKIVKILFLVKWAIQLLLLWTFGYILKRLFF